MGTIMTFNEQIVFDDYVDNTEKYGSYYVEMCESCLEKYRAVLGNRVDDDSAFGTCSVMGCWREANSYVDFDMNEVTLKESE